MFEVLLSYYPPSRPQRSEVAVLRTGILSFLSDADGTTMTGEYVATTCWYVPAVLEYDVVIQGKVVTIPNHPDQGRTVRVLMALTLGKGATRASQRIPSGTLRR